MLNTMDIISEYFTWIVDDRGALTKTREVENPWDSSVNNIQTQVKRTKAVNLT